MHDVGIYSIVPIVVSQLPGKGLCRFYVSYIYSRSSPVGQLGAGRGPEFSVPGFSMSDMGRMPHETPDSICESGLEGLEERASLALSSRVV